MDTGRALFLLEFPLGGRFVHSCLWRRWHVYPVEMVEVYLEETSNHRALYCNTILAISLLIYLHWPRYIEIDGVRERWYMDGLTGMMILSTSAVAALFSAIPISLCCYWFKRNRE